MVKRRMFKRKPKPYRRRKFGKKVAKRMRLTNTSNFKSNFAKVTRMPFGQSQLCMMPYVEHVTISTTLGARAFHAFSLNSAFDPNYTGTGHQPLGYDQMTPIFGKYCVIGAQAKVTFWNKDDNEVIGVALYLSENPTPPGNTVTLIEQGAIQYKFLGPTGQTYNNGNPQTTMYVNVSMKKFFKVASLLDNTELNTPVTNNPTRQCFLHCIVYQPDGGSSSVSATAHVELRQRIVFNQPLNLTSS